MALHEQYRGEVMMLGKLAAAAIAHNDTALAFELILNEFGYYQPPRRAAWRDPRPERFAPPPSWPERFAPPPSWPERFAPPPSWPERESKRAKRRRRGKALGLGKRARIRRIKEDVQASRRS